MLFRMKLVQLDMAMLTRAHVRGALTVPLLRPASKDPRVVAREHKGIFLYVGEL